MDIEKNFVRVSSLFILGIAALVLIGWFADIAVLKSIMPQYVSMKANAAICFLLSAGAVYCRSTGAKKALLYYRIGATLSFIIAAITLAEHITGADAGIDQLLVGDVRSDMSPVPGRMSAMAAICFVFMNMGLLVATTASVAVKRIAQVFFHAITVLSVIAMFGYVFSVPGFYKFTFLTGMALHTAVLMFVLSLSASALLPGVGYARLFLGDEIGNVMSRRLFPFIFLMVFVLGVIRLELHWNNMVTVEMGIALYGMSFMLVSLLLIRNTAFRLNAIDKKRLNAERELRNLNAMLEEQVAIRTRELTKSNLRNKIFVNEAPTAIAMFDTEMRYIAASQKWKSDYGLQRKEIIGKSHYEIFPEIGEDWKQIHRECMAGAINKNDNAYFLREDGSEQWLVWDVRPWYASEGQVGGIIMYTEDITGRKKTEQQLLLSETQFRGAFQSSPTGIAIVSLQGNWVTVNKAICDILGYSEAELMQLTFQDITHPDDLAPDMALVNELLEGKRTYYHLEKRYIHKDGYYIWAILSVSLVRDVAGKPKHFVSQITDINTQRVTQNKLAQALGKLEGILNASTQVSMITTDVNGIITGFNVGAENLLGYSRQEMVNVKTPQIIHREEEVAARGSELSRQLGKTVQGFDVFVELAKVQQYETREWMYVCKDGTLFPVQLTVTAIREQGEITGYLGIAADISEMKRVERELKSLLDVTRDQNERLKNFAHIVSHNLRSHSGNISILIDLFLQENTEKAGDELLQNLVHSANNLKETIVHLNEVVALNTTVSENMKKLHLKTVVDAAIQNVKAIAHDKSVVIENNVNTNLYISGVDAYMDSIVLNFLTNAIKYKSAGKAAYVKVNAADDNGYVVLSFEDNGVGMDLKKVKHKLFGMYKTFHEHADARGIGLFITKNQVEALGGKIEVESAVGEGTTFKVYLKHEQEN